MQEENKNRSCRHQLNFNERYEGFKMTKEEKRKVLERMLKGAPDIMSPRQVHRWSSLGKNHVYELIHKGELYAYNYRSSYIIAKTDLIDYLLAHSDDPPLRPNGTGGRKKKTKQ